jgi:hypothetical protein
MPAALNVARFGRVGVGAALLLARRHTDKDVLGEPERRQHLLSDHVAVVLAGHRLDDHRLGQVRGARVVLQPRARRPVEREITDLGAHSCMVGPRRLGHVTARETALMRHDLVQGYLALAARSEFRQVVGDAVHETQLAFFDQHPYRGARQNLGLTEQKEQCLAGRRYLLGLGLRVAVGPEQRKFSVPRQRDLCAGITAFLDVLPDQAVEMLKRRLGKAEACRVGRWQRIVIGHRCLLLEAGDSMLHDDGRFHYFSQPGG